MGYIPFESLEKVNIIYDFKSDAWTNPHSYKDSPIRYFTADLKVPLYYKNQVQLNLITFADHLSLGESTIEFKSHSVNFNSALLSEKVGLQGRYLFHNQNILQFSAYYRSESDRPFQDERDRWIGADIIYTFAHTKESHFFIAADFDRNRGLLDNQIFPYFGISYNPNDEWEAILGFPMIMVTYGRPDELRYRFSLTPFGSFIETEKNF